MWLTVLTDQLLNDLSSLVGKAKPRPYTDALQSAAACNFQLNSFKCNKTMQEVLEDCGPGFSHSRVEIGNTTRMSTLSGAATIKSPFIVSLLLFVVLSIIKSILSYYLQAVLSSQQAGF